MQSQTTKYLFKSKVKQLLHNQTIMINFAMAGIIMQIKINSSSINAQTHKICFMIILFVFLHTNPLPPQLIL